MEEKRATAGVLVTTAWVSAETKAFAARNNRLRIIEGDELRERSYGAAYGPQPMTRTGCLVAAGSPQ